MFNINKFILSREIKKLKSKYTNITRFDNIEMRDFITYYRKYPYTLFDRVIQFIFGYKYTFENKYKIMSKYDFIKLNKHHCKYAYYKLLDIYKILAANNIKWLHSLLPTGLHYYLDDTGNVGVIPYVTRSIKVNEFLNKLDAGDFENNIIIIYSIVKTPNNDYIIRYAAEPTPFIINL